MQSITILGATGSIGTSTLDVVARHPQRYQIFALTAAHRIEALLTLCRRFHPTYAVVADAEQAKWLEQQLAAAALNTEVLYGAAALCEVAAHDDVDQVMAAIVGAAGLAPTLAAAKAGKKVLLANKEALVMSGRLFIDAVRDNGAQLLPVDSEHNAIFQCLPERWQKNRQPSLQEYGIDRIILTGSGGPFRTTPLEQFPDLTPEQAVNHPNWSMGQKISVDSATMMNKGLEFIEARWLFDVAPDQIEIVLHPQSVIHSMVAYCDGSVLAQLGQPDMRTPIAECMAFPDRITSGVERLDFQRLSGLTFSSPEPERYPALQQAIAACRMGQAATTALNAANEIAVAAFLNNHLRFTDIAQITDKVLNLVDFKEPSALDDVLSIDSWARAQASTFQHRLYR